LLIGAASAAFTAAPFTAPYYTFLQAPPRHFYRWGSRFFCAGPVRSIADCLINTDTRKTVARKPRSLPLIAFVPLVVIAAYSTVGALAVVRDRGDDFGRFYLSAVAWAHGSNPYLVVINDTPNLNHPVLLPVFWLFTLLPQPTAFVVWSIFSLVLLAGCALAIHRHVGLAALDFGVVLLASAGTSVALTFGQVSFLLMAMFTVAWFSDRQGHPVEAAALLGVLTVLKPFFGLFALYFLWRREWRPLFAYAALFFAGTLVGWALVGSAGFAEWLTRLEDVQWRWHIYNASVWGVGDRLFTVQPFFRATGWTPLTVSPLLARTTTMGLLAMVVAIIVRAISKTDLDRSYALLTLGTMLISPLGWMYYLPVSFGPLIVVLTRHPSRWLWPVSLTAFFPYLLLVSRSYGKIGTLVVGQWAFGMIVGLLFLVAATQQEDYPGV
jgi:hypothetical protein